MKKLLPLLTLTSFCTFSAFSQFGGLKKLKDQVVGELPVSKLLEGKPPITTNFKDDVNIDGSLNEAFANDTTFRSLLSLQRSANGGFVLQPGFYELTNRSYCLKAGTHGPSKGDAYMYAPVKGPEEEAVMSILRNSVNHPEIAQHDVQLLLWAIIAKAKFENLQGKTKVAAALLLTPKQLATLNRNALATVSDLALKNGSSSLPPAVQKVLEAENKLRQMFSTGASTYEEFERIAVLAGMAPLEDNTLSRGRWSKHPDGYYIRYFPSGYRVTQVQLWIPQTSAANGKEYDPATHIACPSNTGAQRLAQSGFPLAQQ